MSLRQNPELGDAPKVSAGEPRGFFITKKVNRSRKTILPFSRCLRRALRFRPLLYQHLVDAPSRSRSSQINRDRSLLRSPATFFAFVESRVHFNSEFRGHSQFFRLISGFSGI